MQSRGLRPALAVAAIAAAVALFVVLRDDDGGSESPSPTPTRTSTRADHPPSEPKPATIVVEGGQPVGGVQELEFAKGERVRFVVESDVAEEVHLHGYDVAKEVEAGGRVEFDVPATIEGAFEVELEASSVPLAEISVTPG